jgi:hypothetical protein
MVNPEASAIEKGKALDRFIKGPLRTGAYVTGGIFTAAQLLDIAHSNNSDIPKNGELKATKAKQKKREQEEQLYEQEMEEAYQNGLFIDYTADAIKNKYKLGYQPGLPGDPNYNLVQDMFTNRNNHTRM